VQNNEWAWQKFWMPWSHIFRVPIEWLLADELGLKPRIILSTLRGPKGPLFPRQDFTI
jgi:hypothetical protein